MDHHKTVILIEDFDMEAPRGSKRTQFVGLDRDFVARGKLIVELSRDLLIHGDAAKFEELFQPGFFDAGKTLKQKFQKCCLVFHRQYFFHGPSSDFNLNAGTL